MRKMPTLALGIIAGVSLSSNPLPAWERTAAADCKKESKDCKKSGDQCKNNILHNDQRSFEWALSSYSKQLFEKFSVEEKKKAMDAVDGTNMAPDEAVAKVAGNCYSTQS
ncbi:MAG: hypothetical protein KGZ39_04555 [Simkania sp.]|nr:hypothetical protein [Simkania sp.]